jgi:hypothetical protein
MNPIDVALPLIAALWASATAFLTFTKELNGKRDKILLGEMDGKQLSLEYRQLLLRSDWFPLWIVLIFLTAAFATASLMLSYLLEKQYQSITVWTISAIAAL